MKTVLAAFVSFVVMACPAFAEPITAVTEEMPPFNYTENGIITGFSTEIVRAALTEAGIEADFKSYPWKRAYKMALSNPNTLIYSIGRNPEREDKFKWVGIIAPVNIYFYTLKSRDDITVESLQDAKKYTIGTVSDDYTTQFLTSQGFKNLDMTNSYSLNIRKLFNDRIDLILVDELTIASLIREEAESGKPFTVSQLEKAFFVEDLSTGMYMAYSLATSDDIVRKSKEALEKIKDNGTFDRIMDTYK